MENWESVKEDIYSWTHEEMIAYIDLCESWDDPEELELINYLCNWFGIEQNDEDGEFRGADAIMDDIRTAVKEEK